jgi:hypothetical protein
MTQVIDDYTKDKSPATQKSYRQAYNRLNNLLNVPCECCCSDDIINCLKNADVNIYSKLAMLNIPLVLAKKNKPNNFSFSQIEKFRKELKKQTIKVKLEKNKELVDDLPSLEDLNEYTKYLYDNEKYEAFIVNYLLLNFNCRNADMLIKIVKTTKDIVPELNYNYLIVRDAYIDFKRFNYKTAYKYGTKDKRFKSVKFKNAINKILEKRGGDDGCFLLLDNDDNPYVEENIGARVRRLTKNEIGEGNYLKVIIKDLQQKESHLLLKKLIQISHNRGTNIEVLAKDYNLLLG